MRRASCVAAGVAALGLLLCGPSGTSPVAPVHASGSAVGSAAQAPETFAARIAALSEPGGYFDTDNLISNETSYLQVIPALEEAGLEGGAYVGVGPDQNFSYIAQARPSIAFIIDVRRDNLLLHLLFKALFELAETRVEYLRLLFARPPPPHVEEWRSASVNQLVDYVDGDGIARKVDAMPNPFVEEVIKGFGVPLSAEDLETIQRFHRTFIDRGLSLKFETTGRPPQSQYPSYRELLVQKDPLGRPQSVLASEEAYAFVRSLQRRNLVVPIVGDLGGPSALAAIGKALAARGEHLSALYASNVESYLFTDGKFATFVKNLATLPRSNRSLIIRSVFGSYARLPPQSGSGAGNGSISTVQRIDELLEGHAAGKFRSYGGLVSQ